MRYKKTFCIFLAVAFIITAASGAVAKQKNFKTDGPDIFQKEITGTGTVKETNLKEKYIIETDEEIKIMGLSFDKIYPINQEDVIKEDGIEVEYKAKFSLFMQPRIILMCIFLQALPVYLVDIKPVDEPELSILEGFVKDEEENPISESEIIVKSISESEYNKVEKTLTNEEGYYKLKLKSGEYDVSANKEGYEKESEEVSVEPEETVELNFTLSSIENVVLTLDAQPDDLPLELFSLEPEPIEIMPTTDGKLHAVYEPDTEVEITAQEEHEDYVFEHWSKDAEGNENPLEVLMDEDKNIIAVYNNSEDIQPPKVETLPPFEAINAIILKGKVINDGGEPCQAWFEIYKDDMVIYEKIDVEGEYSSGENFTKTITISEFPVGNNLKYRACISNSADEDKGEFYEINPPEYHTLNIQAIGTGTTNPNPGTYKHYHGTRVEITAVLPNIPGAEFLGWGGDAEGNENPITVEMNENKTIIAHFTTIDPHVETLPAEEITENSALLSGEIAFPDGYHSGEILELGFEWRKVGYGSWNEIVSDDLSGGLFSAVLRNLEAGSQYSFRAYAVKLNGEKIYGEIRSFVTQSQVAPPLVETLPAEKQLPDITLNGKLIYDGGKPCQVWFEIKKPDGSIVREDVEGMYSSGDVFSKTTYIPGVYFRDLYYRACASNGEYESKGSFQPIIKK